MKTARKTRSKKITPSSVLIAFALCAWTAFSFYAAAFITSFTLRLIPGYTSSVPFWSGLFDLVLYIINFFILAFLPFYLAEALKKHGKNDVLKKLPFTIKKPTRDSLGLSGTPTWTDLALAPLGFVVYYIGATIITALLSLLPWFNLNEPQSLGFDTYIFGIDRIFAFLAIVIIAPIGEELTYRGWLYPKLRARLGVVFAIILTSLLFAVMHAQLNVGATVFALSIVMCLLREFTGTIYASILLHMLKNFIAFFIVFVWQIA